MFEDHPCFATLPSFDVNPPALTNAMALKAVQDDGSKLLDNDLAWLEGWEMDACEFEPTAVNWDVVQDPVGTACITGDRPSGAWSSDGEPACVNPVELSRDRHSLPQSFGSVDGGNIAPPPTPQDNYVNDYDFTMTQQTSLTAPHLDPHQEPASDGDAAAWSECSGDVAGDGKERAWQFEQPATGPARRQSSPVSPMERRGDMDDRRLQECRARNKVAAKKCRAKKKRGADDLQKTHRRCSATNSYLKSQERELRTALVSLRYLFLQHDSTRCDCRSLHEFNARQAATMGRKEGSAVGP